MKMYRCKLLNPALMLAFWAMAFRFNDTHVVWFWQGQPGVAIALVAGAVTCAGLMLVPPRRRAGP